MAKISSFLICESIANIQTDQGNIPQLIAPQSVLRLPFIPGSFSFGLALGVTGVLFGMENKAIMTITSPDGKEVYNSGVINLGIVPVNNYLPQEYQGFMISVDIRNMVFPSEGLYTVEIVINEKSAGKQTFPVFRKEEYT